MTTNLITVYVNDIEVKVLENSTVLQACEKIGIKVPRFCYHEKLSIAGNCRMCLVEIKNAPKLQASCALPVMKDSRVYTDSIAVRKAREGIMELLLINHPLDCPICDQGGECDLQDQAMYYGSDHGRFHEYKRATSDKNFGPLIKTIMTRCIHCTRCVRFASEIAGCPELGTIGRGNNMEISTFVRSSFNEGAGSFDQSVLDSELSGNLIDICPVGALTSLPYAFVARPWELKSIISVDVSDTYCSDIKVDIRGQGPGSILRILPATGAHSAWISDKTRFSYDGLKRQRLLTPLLNLDSKQKTSLGQSNNFELKTWDEIQGLKNLIKPNSNITLFLGNNIDLETLNVLKLIKSEAKVNLNLIFIHPDSSRYSNNLKTFYSTDYTDSQSFGHKEDLLNELRSTGLLSLSTTFIQDKDLEKADLCLLISTNPRLESPVLNSCLQKVAKRGTIALFGSNADKLPYPVKHLGNSSSSLLHFINSSKHVNKFLEKSSKGKRILIIGSSLFYRPDALDLLTSLNKFVKDYDFGAIKVLYQSVSELNGLYTGLNVFDVYDSNTLTKIKKSDFIVYYNLPNYALNNPFIQESLNQTSGIKPVLIYIGSHGNILTNKCNWILPVTAFTEKSSSYLSNTGKIKHTTMVTYPPGVALQDSVLFNTLFTIKA